MAAQAQELDVVIWGATGFTGKLVAEYLLERYGVGGDLRWAIGGRNQGKLEGVRRDLGDAATDLLLIVGDNDDADFLASLCKRTRVVCSTVGPYAHFGSKLVAACVGAGTSYCDLSGEMQWIRRMIDQHLAAAAASGARIVHSCGFDCIPSDLGVYFVQREMLQRHGVYSNHVSGRVKSFRGGFSGGTAASMLAMMEEVERDPGVRRLLADPYGLNPQGRRAGPDGRDQIGPAYDSDFASWTAPFIMAALNTRVVRRTNALLEPGYGADFRYDEAMLTGGGPIGLAKAGGISTAQGAAMVGGALGPLRRALSRFVPKPGEGPTREQREKGFFEIFVHARHPTDERKSLRGRVYGDRDPGYGSTAKMLGESAVCLATDDLEVGGGFWTTAAAMGDPLLKRLNENAGVTFTLVD